MLATHILLSDHARKEGGFDQNVPCHAVGQIKKCSLFPHLWSIIPGVFFTLQILLEVHCGHQLLSFVH